MEGATFDSHDSALSLPRRPRRVVYTLPDGQQVAALLRTDLFGALTSTPDVDWLLLSHLADQPEFRSQFEHPHVSLHRLPRLVPPFLDRQIEFLRREFIHHRLDPETSRILYQRARAVEPKRYYFHRPLARLLSVIPGIDTGLAYLQDRFTREREVSQLLDELQPDAVVLSSAAVKFPDIAVGRWARRRGVPLFGIVHSWDNLAIKGPTIRCDHLAVWNQLMVEQAVRLFRYRPEQVSVTGPPHFDVYARGTPQKTRDEFLRELDLTPGRRLITYTTMPPMSSNFAAHFVHQVADWIQRDQLGYPCQLLVRLHPQDNPDLYADCHNLPHVRIELPGRYRSSVSWRQAIYYYDPSQDDVEHLRDTLWFSDVILNIGSTITLEALALDRPVANLAYNPPGSNWPVAIRDYYRLAHYRPVLESGAVRLAYSPAELREAIREALSHPDRRSQERRAIYERLVTYTDGQSALRLASEVLRFLGVSHPALAELQSA